MQAAGCLVFCDSELVNNTVSAATFQTTRLQRGRYNGKDPIATAKIKRRDLCPRLPPALFRVYSS